MRIRDPFLWLAIISGFLVLIFILLPLLKVIVAPSASSLGAALKDHDVRKAIGLSVYTSGMAGLISLLLGTPFAYFLARKNFPFKRLVESVIDLPIVVPHPVVGIAILSVAGKDFWLGRVLAAAGIRIMGSVTGIVVVLTFVGIPFYINAVKNGFEKIPPRLENVSRSLGASLPSTLARITFPLASRSILVGFIMCVARALSEFGAVVVVAYHPMIAPVLIYERFEGYGLAYSQPIAVLLILVCLVIFLILRILSSRRPEKERFQLIH